MSRESMSNETFQKHLRDIKNNITCSQVDCTDSDYEQFTYNSLMRQDYYTTFGRQLSKI